MNLRPFMCWVAAGTVVSVASITAFGQSSSPSRPSRPVRPVDQTVEPAPGDAGSAPSRPGRPVPPPSSDNGSTESQNPYVNPRGFLDPQPSIGAQSQVKPSAIARKSGDWSDPAVWGIGEQGPRPINWPIELPWPIDPRTHEVDVYTGNWTITVQGDARARSCSGTIAGSGVLSLSGAFSGTVLGSTIRTRELSGSVNMIDGVLDAMGGTLVLDYRRTDLGRLMPVSATTARLSQSSLPSSSAQSYLAPFSLRLNGCGVVRGSVRVSNGGALTVTTCPPTLPRAEAFGLSISGDLELLPGSTLTMDVPSAGPVERLTNVLLPATVGYVPLLQVDGSVSACGISSTFNCTVDVEATAGRSVAIARFGGGIGKGLVPFTTIKAAEPAVVPGNQSHRNDSRPSPLYDMVGPDISGNQRDQVRAERVSKLSRAAQVSTDAFAAAVGIEPDAWWAMSFTPELLFRSSGLELQVTPPIKAEAIGVRLPETPSGVSIDFASLSSFDNLVLVTHGTRSSGDRSHPSFIDADRVSMGQIATMFDAVANQVNAPYLAQQNLLVQGTPSNEALTVLRTFGRFAGNVDPRWHIAVLDWREWATGNDGSNPEGVLAKHFNPNISAFYGQQIGRSLADEIVSHRAMWGKGPMKRLHLLAHSSGSWLVDAIADRLREHWGPREQGGPDITLTFFDAFDQGGTQAIFGAQGELGDSADTVEHYFDNAMPGTQAKGAGLPRNAMNFDVTQLRSRTDRERYDQEVNKHLANAGMPPVGTSSVLDWVYMHGWPYEWYLRTMQAFITDGSPVKPCEGDRDCKWREWGVIRSPLAQDFLALQRSSGQEKK